MRKLAFGTAALAALAVAGPALAADIPAPVYKAPVVAPILYSWTGFYVGANGGYSWGRGGTDFAESVTQTATLTNLIGGIGGVPGPGNGATATVTTVGGGSGTANINGWLGGLQAGYNWQSNNWVFGWEADAQLTGQRGSILFCGTPCGAGAVVGGANYSLPWFATLRGRAGIAWNRVLFYATGGLAVAEFKGSYFDGLAGGPGFASAVDSTRFGYVVGVGVEGALTNQWTLKVEYLFMDLGSVSSNIAGASTATNVIRNNTDFFTAITTNTTAIGAFHTRLTDNIIRIGLNYRFGAVESAVVTKY